MGSNRYLLTLRILGTFFRWSKKIGQAQAEIIYGLSECRKKYKSLKREDSDLLTSGDFAAITNFNIQPRCYF